MVPTRSTARQRKKKRLGQNWKPPARFSKDSVPGTPGHARLWHEPLHRRYPRGAVCWLFISTSKPGGPRHVKACLSNTEVGCLAQTVQVDSGRLGKTKLPWHHSGGCWELSLGSGPRGAIKGNPPSKVMTDQHC